MVASGVAAGNGLRGGGDEWLARFQAWHKENEFRALAKSNSANLAWFEAPLLRSYLYLFSATGDTFWLERFVFHSDSILRMMRDVPDTGYFWPGYADGFLGWGTTVYDPAGFYQEYLVHDAVICLPLVRFVLMVYQDKGLQARFKERADFYRSVVEKEVVGKWYASWNARRGEGGELERFGGWRFVPLNQFLAFGELLALLKKVHSLPAEQGVRGVVPVSFYTAVPESMAQVFFQSLVLDLRNDAWVWGHWAGYGFGKRVEDISHANIDISFAIAMTEQGCEFCAADLARFARTLLRVVKAEDSSGVFLYRFVNGSGPKDSILLLESWVRLGRFAPDVYGLVAELLRQIPVTRMNVSMAVTTAVLVLEMKKKEDEERADVDRAEGRVAQDGVAGSKGGILIAGENGAKGVTVFDVSGRRCRAGAGAGVYFRFGRRGSGKVVVY